MGSQVFSRDTYQQKGLFGLVRGGKRGEVAGWRGGELLKGSRAFVEHESLVTKRRGKRKKERKGCTFRASRKEEEALHHETIGGGVASPSKNGDEVAASD